jgi:HD superfamily phosphodiesterase
MDNELLKKVEDYVTSILNSHSSPKNIYHDISHTLEVVAAAEEIGRASGLSDSDLEILLIAAWFHDIGYIDTVNGHEKKSIERAEKFLGNENYSEDKIAKVIGCIKATEMPQSPKSFIEEVLCDADLSHIGRKSFKNRNELYRSEIEARLGKKLSEYDFLKQSIDFFSHHTFFTDYARNEFNEMKSENLYKLQKKFRKLVKKSGEEDFDDHDDSKEYNYKKTGRGVETMFRNTMRTHVEFSALADNKANIMISVNTLIITAVMAVLASKLDKNPHLAIPTLIIILVSLSTLVFAVLVTRPIITSGKFTKKEILEKRANLLFFGNFHKMPLEDFSWGMKQMINDQEYLYESMIKDFSHLGQVLGIKYKYLRICYNIFIYGIIISVIAFGIAIMLYPHSTVIDQL